MKKYRDELITCGNCVIGQVDQKIGGIREYCRNCEESGNKCNFDLVGPPDYMEDYINLAVKSALHDLNEDYKKELSDFFKKHEVDVNKNKDNRIAFQLDLRG